MGIYNITPWGKKKYRPGMSSRMRNEQGKSITDSFSRCILVCPSQYADPEESYEIASPADAENYLGNKEMAFSGGYSANPLKYLDKLWNPSPDPNIAGADVITFVDACHRKTRASWALVDGSSHGCLTIKMRRFNDNSVKLLLGASTNYVSSVGMKLTVLQDGVANVVADDLGPALCITSSGATPTVTITKQTYIPADGSAREDRAIQLSLEISGVVVQTYNLRDKNYRTLSQLASAISQETSWDAYVPPGTDSSMPSVYLDPCTAKSVTSGSGYVLFSANLGSFIWALSSSDILYAEKTSTAIDTYYDLPAELSTYTYPTTPATCPEPTNQDWFDAIDVAFEKVSEPAHICVATTSTGVLAYLSSRLAYYKQRDWRRCWRSIVGHPAVQETGSNPSQYSLDQIKLLRKQLNNYDMVLASPEVIDLDVETNLEESYNASYLAAALTGMRVGNYRMSLTYKQVKFSDVGRKYGDTELEGADGLISNRVTCLVPINRTGVFGFRVECGLTAYGGGTDALDVDEYVSWVKWYLNAFLCSNVEKFIGEVPNPKVDKTMLWGEAVRLFNLKSDTENRIDPLLVANPANPINEPAFQINSVTFEEGAWLIDYNAGVIAEAKWVNFNGTIQNRKLEQA